MLNRRRPPVMHYVDNVSWNQIEFSYQNLWVMDRV